MTCTALTVDTTAPAIATGMGGGVAMTLGRCPDTEGLVARLEGACLADDEEELSEQAESNERAQRTAEHGNDMAEVRLDAAWQMGLMPRWLRSKLRRIREPMLRARAVEELMAAADLEDSPLAGTATATAGPDQLLASPRPSSPPWQRASRAQRLLANPRLAPWCHGVVDRALRDAHLMVVDGLRDRGGDGPWPLDPRATLDSVMGPESSDAPWLVASDLGLGTCTRLEAMPEEVAVWLTQRLLATDSPCPDALQRGLVVGAGWGTMARACGLARAALPVLDTVHITEVEPTEQQCFSAGMLPHLEDEPEDPEYPDYVPVGLGQYDDCSAGVPVVGRYRDPLDQRIGKRFDWAVICPPAPGVGAAHRSHDLYQERVDTRPKGPRGIAPEIGAASDLTVLTTEEDVTPASPVRTTAGKAERCESLPAKQARNARDTDKRKRQRVNAARQQDSNNALARQSRRQSREAAMPRAARAGLDAPITSTETPVEPATKAPRRNHSLLHPGRLGPTKWRLAVMVQAIATVERLRVGGTLVLFLPEQARVPVEPIKALNPETQPQAPYRAGYQDEPSLVRFDQVIASQLGLTIRDSWQVIEAAPVAQPWAGTNRPTWRLSLLEVCQ